ncbi:MAG TPA: PEP_CTERM-anchored TLD domain-containing protein [Alphaproteobacteria bacterium]|nr:PEP_CTERM-anchored TLD domain-containing protein [Alphaproteobacteria bacterium]
MAGIVRCLGVVLTAMIVGIASAQAVPITGGSALLTDAHASQLETWLGQGPISLTNIFTKTTGQNTVDWHQAVDGEGPTITVMEVLPGTYQVHDDQGQHAVTTTESILIGGYNPQSWSSAGDYTITLPDSMRTAFLFNLSDTIKQDQNLSSEGDAASGSYQVYNTASYGPTFGGGHDLVVDSLLLGGYTKNYSFGGTSFAADIMNLGGFYTEQIRIGGLETFTIAAYQPPAAVPEPSTLVLIGAGFVALGVIRRRKAA